MCDYSLHAVKSRAAKKGDELIVKTWPSSMGSKGFADVNDQETAVCLLPGTEIAFENDAAKPSFFQRLLGKKFGKVGVFRQINKEIMATHHDAIEYLDGSVVTIQAHATGNRAKVLQLPAAPKTIQESKEQERLEYLGI